MSIDIERKRLNNRQHYWAHRDEILDRKFAYYRANSEYLREQGRRRYRKLKGLVEEPRTGRWTEEEDSTVMRTDITLAEMACILRRSYGAVKSRRATLRRRG